MPHELHHEGFGVLRFTLILAPVRTIKSGRLEVLFSRYVHFLCNIVLAKLEYKLLIVVSISTMEGIHQLLYLRWYERSSITCAVF